MYWNVYLRGTGRGMTRIRDRHVKDEVAALNIGSQVRQLRNRRGLTLREVADMTGLSKPLLSRIENSITAPPVATLIKISMALGVKIGHFFQETSLDSRLVVVRKEDRYALKRLGHPDQYAGIGYSYESLAYPMVNKQMEPFIVEIDPCDENRMCFNNHHGEEFIFVLDGTLEFRNSSRTLVLNEGDSIYFDSGVPHGLRGLGGPARVLVVVHIAR